MSTLATILGSVVVADTRDILNENFEALNTDKSERYDVQRQSYVYAQATGLSNSYAVVLSPVPTAYTEGMLVSFKANAANTGICSLNVNGLGAKIIKKSVTLDLDAGDIISGQIVNVLYDGANFQMLAGVGSSTTEGFWISVPGNPVRASDTQFTLTDSSNAGNYDKLFSKETVLRWTESGAFKTAMVVSSSYSLDVVTINIVGDSLGSTFQSLKYASETAKRETFIIPGSIGAGTDLAKTWYPSANVYPLSVDARDKTAGTTNATVIDVNDDGTTIITTKPSIASGDTSDLNNKADSPSSAPILADSAVTIDVDSVSTTAPIELYVDLFYYPVSWRYRS